MQATALEVQVPQYRQVLTLAECGNVSFSRKHRCHMCNNYLKHFSVSQNIRHQISLWVTNRKLEKYLNGSGRGPSLHLAGEAEDDQEISVRIFGAPPDIQTIIHRIKADSVANMPICSSVSKNGPVCTDATQHCKVVFPSTTSGTNSLIFSYVWGSVLKFWRSCLGAVLAGKLVLYLGTPQSSTAFFSRFPLIVPAAFANQTDGPGGIVFLLVLGVIS